MTAVKDRGVAGSPPRQEAVGGVPGGLIKQGQIDVAEGERTVFAPGNGGKYREKDQYPRPNRGEMPPLSTPLPAPSFLFFSAQPLQPPYLRRRRGKPIKTAGDDFHKES